jgi:pyruvate kinase
VASPSGRPLIIASIDPRTPELEGIDLVRLDAAASTAVEISRLRSRSPYPALLDIPGPRTRRAGSPLTTSEFLVFASVEEFEWINLRGVRKSAEIDQAREFLHPETRVAVTIASAGVLHRSLDEICTVADAVVLSCVDLAKAVGQHHLHECLRVAIARATSRQKPCLLSAGVLPSMRRSAVPRPSELDWLSSLIQDGCRGFVLTEETLHGRNPQVCVDVLQLLAETGRVQTRAATTGRAAARLAGTASPRWHEPGSADVDDPI